MPDASSSVSGMSFEDFMSGCQSRVNGALESLIMQTSGNATLREAMAYACLEGGKRIRPVLVYGAAEAVEARLPDADTPACAVEMVHSYSLAHDDLPAMDDDSLRRGKPSLHKAFGEATAILVGDALQSLAFQTLAHAESTVANDVRLHMIASLSQAIGASGMAGGQYADFHVMGRETSIEQLESMHSLKTGALIRASVTLGALCQPDLDQPTLLCLQNYADCIGLAFQVQDDILDEVGDTATLGKPQGSDRLKSKPTCVSLLGVDAARARVQALSEQALEQIASLPSSAAQLRNLAAYTVSRTH